jgi:hypothetical protein
MPANKAEAKDKTSRNIALTLNPTCSPSPHRKTGSADMARKDTKLNVVSSNVNAPQKPPGITGKPPILGVGNRL